MPQIKFLSSDCHKKYEQEAYIFMEVDFYGQHIRIDLGIMEAPNGNQGPAIKVVAYGELEVSDKCYNAVYVSMPDVDKAYSKEADDA